MITLTTITELTAEAFGLTPDDIHSGHRQRRYVVARHAAYSLMRQHTDASFSRIGEHLAGRDHTTINSGIHSAEARYRTDADYRATFDKLNEQIRLQDVAQFYRHGHFDFLSSRKAAA